MNKPLSASLRYKIQELLAVATVMLAVLIPANTLQAAANSNSQLSGVDGLMPVDCLLPGSVRKLGKSVTYLAARRALKTTGVDCEIRGGEYIVFDRADYKTALKIWQPMAEGGDPRAQNYVGEIYERGLGIAPNYSLAAEWYNKAAGKGFAAAQINLGQLHEQGLGVEKSMDTAIELYRKAAGFNNKQLKFVSWDYSDEKYAELQQQLSSLTAKLDQSLERQRTLQLGLVEAQSNLKADHLKLNALRQQLREAERSAVRDTSVEELRTTLAGQEKILSERETELLEKNALLTSLSVEVHALRTDVAIGYATVPSAAASMLSGKKLTGETLAKKAPLIEVLEPQLASNESGLYFAKTRAGLARTIVGRVISQQEVQQVMINSESVSVDSEGIFQHRVRLGDDETRVEIVAIDNLGVRGDLAFMLGIENLVEQKNEGLAESSVEGNARPIPKIKYGNYRALLIGNQNYKSLPDLDTTVNDINAVGAILTEKYGFTVTKLVNASRYDILSALELLRQQLTDKDNLLVYYAGHGELDEVNNRGHWLPVDAEENSRANWISNVALSDILNAMNANKVLVVADSCYSGAMTRSPIARFESRRSNQDWKPWLKQQASKQSRLLLSSGGVAPVQDGGGGEHSVFARALLNVLDSNDSVLEGRAAHSLVSRAVVTASRANQFEQTPRYAPLKFTGHEGGDFLFVPQS